MRYIAWYARGTFASGLLKKKGFMGWKVKKSGEEKLMNLTFKIDETHRGVSEKIYLLNGFCEHFGIVFTDRWNHRMDQMELQVCIDEQTLCKMYERSRSH